MAHPTVWPSDWFKIDAIRVAADRAAELRGLTARILVTPASLVLLLLLPHFDPSIKSPSDNMVVLSAPGGA
jgi:hypothetical protein